MPRTAAVMVRVFIAAASAVSFCGCTQLPDSAVRQLDHAYKQLENKRYADCESTLNPVIKVYPTCAEMAPAYYMRGQSRLMQSQRESAKTDFKTACNLTSNREFRAWINAQLGNVAFDDQRFSEACMYYGRAVPDLPLLSPADRVLFQYGTSLQRSRKFTEARTVFAELLQCHPYSKHADEARQKYAWTGETFSVQCGSFSRMSSAENSAAKLREKGIDALAYPEHTADSKRYVVRVGRYRTHAEAHSVLERVRNVQPDAFIVP